MGRVLNFWTENEAIDGLFYEYPDPSYDDLKQYLSDYAPWLLKHAERIWDEINL